MLLGTILISSVSGDTDICTPSPNVVTAEISHIDEWTNVTYRTIPCYVWVDAGYGDVYGEPCPAMTFTSNVTCGIVPFPVQYTDHSTATTSWFWDFGDGVNSTDQNPVIWYNVTGVYDVDHSASDGTTSWYNLSGYMTARPAGDSCYGIEGYGNDRYSSDWFWFVRGWI